MTQENKYLLICNMLPTWLSMDISDQNLDILSSGKKCHQLIRDHLNSGFMCASKVLHKTGFIHFLNFLAASQMLWNVTYSLLYFKLLFLTTQFFFFFASWTLPQCYETKSIGKLILSHAIVQVFLHIHLLSQMNLFWSTDHNSDRS